MHASASPYESFLDFPLSQSASPSHSPSLTPSTILSTPTIFPTTTDAITDIITSTTTSTSHIPYPLLTTTTPHPTDYTLWGSPTTPTTAQTLLMMDALSMSSSAAEEAAAAAYGQGEEMEEERLPFLQINTAAVGGVGSPQIRSAPVGGAAGWRMQQRVAGRRGSRADAFGEPLERLLREAG
ncbi:hypothetical protein HDU67_008368 [Dinochytrium kinnereticum]|nr:hypothetical protein HDU67_008368 [Dinochytrium kinnereticum]